MCGYVYICVCMCVDVWICVCACVHVCTCIWYMCVCIFMCACMCVHKPAGVLGAQAHQLDGLPSQLPFISLIGLDQVGLHQMCVCLGAYSTAHPQVYTRSRVTRELRVSGERVASERSRAITRCKHNRYSRGAREALAWNIHL